MALITCPSCGAQASLDVLVEHDALRKALAEIIKTSTPLGTYLYRYVGLFKPVKQKMRAERLASLLNELLGMIKDESIRYNGRDWVVPATLWEQGFEVMGERAINGKFDLPLKNHNYLFAILSGLADKAEAAEEQEREAQRRNPASSRRAGVKGAVSVAEATRALDPELSKIKNHTGDPMPEDVKKRLEELKGTKP